MEIGERQTVQIARSSFAPVRGSGSKGPWKPRTVHGFAFCCQLANRPETLVVSGRLVPILIVGEKVVRPIHDHGSAAGKVEGKSGTAPGAIPWHVPYVPVE
jgi:hypothetical protein